MAKQLVLIVISSNKISIGIRNIGVIHIKVLWNKQDEGDLRPYTDKIKPETYYFHSYQRKTNSKQSQFVIITKVLASMYTHPRVI